MNDDEDKEKLLEKVEKLLNPALSAWEVQVWRTAYLQTLMKPNRTAHDHPEQDAWKEVVRARDPYVCHRGYVDLPYKSLGWGTDERDRRVWISMQEMRIQDSTDQVTVGLDQVWENVFVRVLSRTYPNFLEADNAAKAAVRIVAEHRKKSRS